LIIAPLSTALAGTGAAGWASGSHRCSGTMPALTPKPARSRPTMRSRCAAPPTARGQVGELGAAGGLHGQDEPAEDRDLAEHGQGDVDPPRSQREGRPVVHDQPVGGHGHHREQGVERHRVAGEQQAEVAGHRQQEQAANPRSGPGRVRA
jgi:hypothetical protein